MLRVFYQSVVLSTIFFAVVSWGTGIKAKDTNRLNELIRKADSAVVFRLATLEELEESRLSMIITSLTTPPTHSMKL